VNSCLNLGYTILTSETFGALYSAGFDPYVGVVHAVLPGRPALALDMIEEFRHIIDRLILALFNRRQLSPDKHFETDDANLVRLNADGRRVFFTEYERIMNRPVRAIDDSNSPPRRRLHEQVEIFAETVMSEVPYRPFIWNE
jgi:CRISPR-associated protein Cas1